MPKPAAKELTGIQKAAVLLVALGPEAAASVTKHLSREDLEAVTMEIARTRDIPASVRDQVLQEFQQMAMAHAYYLEAGLEYAQEMLMKALGPERAKDILSKVRGTLESDTFDVLSRVDADQVLAFLQNEHPQTIALVLARLQPRQAAAVLSHLPADVQPDVVARMAQMDQISQETFGEIDAIVQEHLSGVVRRPTSRLGGVEAVAEILNQADRSTEKNIMGMLDRENPDLASQIKNYMFVFEDIVHLMDRDIQRVLKEVESKDLALALKVASEDVKNKIFSNISQRAAEMLREEIEYLGPVRLKSVEEAQQKIVDAIRRLEDAGEITVSRGGEEEEIIV
jgi:flagellar motor switch protein FliG